MRYDIIVIGAGSGGLSVAVFMVKAGFKTLLIDKSDREIGGDCLNHGCVPSKALIHVSRMARYAKNMSPFGMDVKGQVDVKKVMDYVREKQDVIRRHENATYFRNMGMDVELGEVKFSSKDSITINGKTHSAKRIVLATGSRARKLKVPGTEKVQITTNKEIFDMKRLPEKLLMVGGGPIGIELGQAFNRLGSKVTILERGSKFLPKESEEIAQVLLKQLQKEGIHFKFNSFVKEFTGSHEAVVANDDGKEEKMEFDAIFVGIGRQPNIENLDLEKAGIEVKDGRLVVDDQLRTTNKNVLAVGDVAGSFQFTHAANMHAGLIITNFFSPLKKKLNNDYLSWVTYTSPEIATFGLQEPQLKKKGITYEKLSLDFNHDDRAIVDDYTEGKLVLYVRKNRILGGSMVTLHAGELFQELVLAMSTKMNIKSIFKKVYPYPTAASINKRIVMNHLFKNTSPFVKKVLKWLY